MKNQKKREWEEKNNLKVNNKTAENEDSKKITLAQTIKDICVSIHDDFERTAEKKYIQKQIRANYGKNIIGKEPGE